MMRGVKTIPTNEEEECSRYSLVCSKLGPRLADNDYSDIYATSSATAIAGAKAEIERWCIINRDKFAAEGQLAHLYWEVIDQSMRRVAHGTRLVTVPNKYEKGVEDPSGFPGHDDEGNVLRYHIWDEKKVREDPRDRERGWRTDYDVRISLCGDRILRADTVVGTRDAQVKRCTCEMCLHTHINQLREKMGKLDARIKLAEDRRALVWAIILAEADEMKKEDD